MHVRLIGISKIVIWSECERVWLFVSFVSFVSVMDWRPVQGVTHFSPDDCWNMLLPPRNPTDRLSGYRKWMDLYLELAVSGKNFIVDIYNLIVTWQNTSQLSQFQLVEKKLLLMSQTSLCCQSCCP